MWQFFPYLEAQLLSFYLSYLLLKDLPYFFYFLPPFTFLTSLLLTYRAYFFNCFVKPLLGYAAGLLLCTLCKAS